MILEGMGDDADLVLVETLSYNLVVREPDAVERYRQAFKGLQGLAVTGEPPLRSFARPKREVVADSRVYAVTRVLCHNLRSGVEGLVAVGRCSSRTSSPGSTDSCRLVWFRTGAGRLSRDGPRSPRDRRFRRRPPGAVSIPIDELERGSRSCRGRST